MRNLRVLPLLAALALLLLLPSAAHAADPTPEEREQRLAAMRWKNSGLLTEIGDFDPEAVLTRGEAAELFSALLGLSERADLSAYKDIRPDTPHAAALSKCAAAGILSGVEEHRMAPEEPATKRMLATMLNRAMHGEGQWEPWAGTGRTLASMAYRDTEDSWTGATGFQMMALLDRAIDAYTCQQNAVLPASGRGVTLVSAPEVIVTGSMEELVIAPGAAGGVVTLEDASVNGHVYVCAPVTLFLSGLTTVNSVILTEGGQNTRVIGDGQAIVVSVRSEVPEEAETAPAAETPQKTEQEEPDQGAEAAPEETPGAEAEAPEPAPPEETVLPEPGEQKVEWPEAAEGEQSPDGDALPEPEETEIPEFSAIGRARLVDSDAMDVLPYEEYSVNARPAEQDETGDVVIEVSMRGLRPFRSGAAGSAYWTGFSITAPEGATGYRVAYSSAGSVFSLPESYPLNNGGFTRYFDAARWTEYYVLLEWTGPGLADENGPRLYKVDFSDVELDTAPLTEAGSPLGTLGTAALSDLTAGGGHKDVLYGEYGITVENIKDERGSYLELTVHAGALEKHRSSAGEGWWAGFSVIAPDGAASCRFSPYLSLETARKNFSSRTPVPWEDFRPDVDGKGHAGVRQLTDASDPGQRSYWAVLQWYADEEGTQAITTALVFHIVVDAELVR